MALVAYPRPWTPTSPSAGEGVSRLARDARAADLIIESAEVAMRAFAALPPAERPAALLRLHAWVTTALDYIRRAPPLLVP